MTKQRFCEIIDSLRAAEDTRREVNAIFQRSRDHIENDFMNAAALQINHEGIVAELLALAMGYEGDTLEWWLFECDYGRKFRVGSFTEADGKEIDISTAEKLYEYLRKGEDGMTDFKAIFAILHTGGITVEQIKAESPDIEDSDAQNYVKIFALMDGQKAVMCPALTGDSALSFCGIADKGVDREVSYLLEQDSECGCFIDNREDFDREYDSGEYSRDVNFTIEKKYIEEIPYEKWMEDVSVYP